MGIPIKANWQTHENVKLSKAHLKEQLSFQRLLYSFMIHPPLNSEKNDFKTVLPDRTSFNAAI